ncbi:MAG: hypothetical protein K6E33_06340 [Lachnospiraceae bacterium]|nr:hypothetical protein [Lachnospiraceae bacterium]
MKRGVYKAQKKDGSIYYRASITFSEKHISLSSFDTEKEAHKAYVEAGKLLLSTAPADDYHATLRSLPFSKWVSLVNFRDNGIYSASPVYLYKTYFFYYLAPGDYLIFDNEDLFYYSSHRIIRRGNRLFVSDYGSQIGILTRYGVRIHAVPGRDYRFKNGDSSDLRVSNIEVLNSYFGVTRTACEGRVVFEASIHINGYSRIGFYNTPEEAAVAYNKAADMLMKEGIKRKYSLNYIESLKPSVYAKMYAETEIPDSVFEAFSRMQG